jgi:sortase A
VSREHESRHSQPRVARSRGGFIVVGVVGELFLTLGVFLVAFLVWQMWWTDVQGNAAQATIVKNLGWGSIPAVTADPSAGASTPGPDPRQFTAPPVLAEPAHATTFATLLVPRWGSDYQRPVSEGVDAAVVLDHLGIGHYPGTAMPGAVGNFAIAGHRTTYGKPFNRIAEIQVGDALVVRTQATWYVYDVTSTEIVKPQDVAVIAPVPDQVGATPTDRMITLTSCNPMYSAAQRYVVHGKLAYWEPTSGPAPAELKGPA